MVDFVCKPQGLIDGGMAFTENNTAQSPLRKFGGPFPANAHVREMVMRRLYDFELQTKHLGPRRGCLRMNSRDLHIPAASRPGEMSRRSAIEPVATRLFEFARHRIIFHTCCDEYRRSAILNLHSPEHHITQFTPS